MLCDIESEKLVLAGLLKFDKNLFIDCSDILHPTIFSDKNHQCIYRVLIDLYEEFDKLDPTTIISTIQKYDLGFKLDILDNLKDLLVDRDNVRLYSKKIVKLYIARESQSKHRRAYENIGKLNGTESLEQILSISEDVVFELEDQINGSENEPELLFNNSNEILQSLIDHPRENIGIPTPWPFYNEAIGNGIKSGVAIVAARPKQGKSTLCNNAGLHVSGMNIPVLYIDTEMNRQEQLIRGWSSLSNVGMKNIEKGKIEHGQKELIFGLNNQRANLPYYHYYAGGKSFNEILRVIRRWLYKKVKFGPDGKANPCLLIYDYFKLMDAGDLDKMAEFQAIGFQISKLSDLCKTYDIPCLASVQVNRDGITKESSDILAQSDRLLWLCTSASVFKEKTPEEIAEDGSDAGTHKLIILESRFGEKLNYGDYINMKFNRKTSNIKELGLNSARRSKNFDVEIEQETF